MTEERSGFSLASVLLSYLMIAGGVSAALLGLSYLHLDARAAELAFYGAFAAGGFVGGFFAARASRGSTVLEPVIGAVLVVGTLGGLLLTTEIGNMIWHFARETMTRQALFIGGATLVGSLVGAWISERLLGESTRSSIPWVLYVAIAVIGGCFLAFLAAAALRYSGMDTSTIGGLAESDRAMQLTIFAGIGAGCLLAGLVSGASARTRVLVASFLGAVAGVIGFWLLVTTFSGSQFDRDTILGFAVIGAGGGVLALLASAVGWAAVGRRGRA